MKVNIVMITKNRQYLAHQALRTLMRNTSPEMYTMTLIDDGSSIPPMLKDGWAYLRVGHSQGITGKARNLGVYWSEKYFGRGDYLYLSDDDVYFTPGWLEFLVDTMQRSILSVLGGWNHPFLQPRVDDSAITFGNGKCIKTHDAVAGASQLMRWETWDKYGPLDAHAPGVGQSEDWKFCQDIVKSGGQVGSIYPRVIYNCGLTNSFGLPSPGGDVMLKDLQDAKKLHPDLYWE